MRKNIYVALLVVLSAFSVSAHSFAAESANKGKPSKAAELKAKALESMAACKADADKFCGEQEGASKMKKCLKEHMTQLTATCKAQVMGSSGLMK